MKVLLDKNKPYFKASLHCHSTFSDGTVSVEEQKKLFKENGYSVVAFSDHEHLVDNSYLDDDEFLTVTSCEVAIKEFPELSTLKKTDMRVTHLNFYARDQHNVITPCYSKRYDHFITNEVKDKIAYEGEYERVYSPSGINEMIRTAKEKGFLVQYNHPDWSLECAADYLQYENLDFVEVYNHGVYEAGGDSYIIKAYDDMLRNGKKVHLTMCDDSHSKAHMFGGWVNINAERLEYGAIINALEKGDFYASQGPQIYSLVLEGDAVKIKTSSAVRIALSTRGRRCDLVRGDDVCEAEFKVYDNDGYFRITVVDKNGKIAHTQAYEV